MSRSRSVAAFASLLVVSSLLVLAGCSGAEAGIDLTSPPSAGTPTPDPADPADPPVCTARAATCDPGDEQVASESACRGDYCYSRTDACSGALFWCAHPAQRCGAIPRCEADDREVAACPKGASCYEETLCGSTIVCARATPSCTAFPTCDPGDAPVKYDECSGPGAVGCYSRTACGFTLWCVPAN